MQTIRPPEGGYTPELVEHYLRRAGATLMALGMAGLRPKAYGSCMPAPTGSVVDDRRYPPPAARRISEMDQVLSWPQLIPELRLDHRKVVSAHMMTNPETGRPIFSFRRIGDKLGLHHATVKGYWLTGVDTITVRLNAPLICQQSPFAGTRGVLKPRQTDPQRQPELLAA